MLLTEELAVLKARVDELGTIAKDLTLEQLCTSIAYSHYEQSENFTTLDELKQILYSYCIAHTLKKEFIEFDAEVQEKAFIVLEGCYRVRCSEYGFLLADSDIIAGLVLATDSNSEVAEMFFNQHCTKQGVVR